MKWHEYKIKSKRYDLGAGIDGSHQSYLQAGFLGELGELCEVVKKCYRDGSGNLQDPEWQARVQKKAGDALWYAAQLGWSGTGTPAYPTPRRVIHELFHAVRPGVRMGCVMALISLAGLEFEDVLDANLAKLQDRADRNALQGDGDER